LILCRLSPPGIDCVTAFPPVFFSQALPSLFAFGRETSFSPSHRLRVYFSLIFQFPHTSSPAVFDFRTAPHRRFFFLFLSPSLFFFLRVTTVLRCSPFAPAKSSLPFGFSFAPPPRPFLLFLLLSSFFSQLPGIPSDMNSVEFAFFSQRSLFSSRWSQRCPGQGPPGGSQPPYG